MDACYRQLHRAAVQAMKNPVASLDDELKSAVDAAEGLYKNWYLMGLERAWEQAAGFDLAAQGYASGIDRQERFYMNEVGPLSKAGRVFTLSPTRCAWPSACTPKSATTSSTSTTFRRRASLPR